MQPPPDVLPLLSLGGSPQEMGTQHGQAAGGLIREGILPRLDLCREFPAVHGRPRTEEEIRALALACLPAHEAFCPELLIELRATAEAAEVDFLELFIYNGFTDFKDLLYADGTSSSSLGVAGCTTFAVAGEATADGRLLLGQTWDMYASALPFVSLLELRPDGAPAALMVSLAGCVGMFGLNDAGVAICTNNLHAKAGRPGVFWPFLMRRILACRSFREAADLLDKVELAGGHNFLLAGPQGELGEWEILPFVRAYKKVERWTVHTNHCLQNSTQGDERIDGEIGRASSQERHRQARDFFEKTPACWRPSDLAALTRTESASSPHGICMQVIEGYPVQTCAAAIFRPSRAEAWTLRGRPTEGKYRRSTVPGRTQEGAQEGVDPEEDFS